MKTLEIHSFLQCPTPHVWIEKALKNISLLLIDHAHCEKKAAATAIGLIYRYPDKPLLLRKMSRLAREELRHFEQVLEIIAARGEAFFSLSPGSYATNLHRFVTTHEPNKLIDTLIVGAFIEARSCERFGRLAEYLEGDLATFYKRLCKDEARHFQEYINLASHYSNQAISDRITYFSEIEAELINRPEAILRFHSGIPADEATLLVKV